MDQIILKSQGKSDGDHGILSKDGTIIDKGCNKYNLFADQMNNACRRVNKLHRQPKSPIYLVGKNEYLIRSNFKEKDIAERRIAFQALVKTVFHENIITLLVQEAKIHGYTIDDNDILEFEKIIKHNKTIIHIANALEIVGISALTIGLSFKAISK